MLKEASKNLLEDPDIYEYDSKVDDYKEARKMIEVEKKKNVYFARSPYFQKESKYVSLINNASEKRKIEQSINYENMAKKEMDRENKEYGNKDRYVTSS